MTTATRQRRIIGVGGQYENGKDSLADYLAKRLNGEPAFLNASGGPRIWHRNAFATGVKKVFCDTFNVDIAWVEKWKRIDTPPPGFLKTVRQCLIDIGDGFRAFKPDVWIERALAVPGDVVISDARYINEMEALNERGGVNILMWRPGHENDNPNASEQQLMSYVRKFRDAGIRGPTCDPLVHVFVVNDGTVDDLCQQADELVVPYIVDRFCAATATAASIPMPTACAAAA